MTTESPNDTPARRDGTGQVSYAIFDQALWTRFSEADSVEGFVESGMTGAFRVSLVHNAEEVVLSPYGFVDTPSRRATLAAAIASHF